MAKEKRFFVDECGELRVGNLILVIVGAILALVVIFGSFKVISAEQVGVPVTLGKVGDTPRYGLTMKWPIITRFVKFDKTAQRMKLTDETYTKDMQNAKIVYSFMYRIVPDRACELYLAAGRGYEDKWIDPCLDDALKGICGHWTATELVSHRNEVANEIEELLRKELPAGYFTDISVKLDDITYSDAFEKGIEEKVLAEQEALKAKNKTVQIEEEGRQSVIKAKAEADAAIAAAEGKAKAMDIEGAAIRRNSQYLELKKLDVQLQMAESAKGWQTVIMSGGQANALLNVPSK